jgi:N6-L-threonylcarbamoyladenine synthase
MTGSMCILAVESSCDDTAAAVLEGTELRASVVASQDDIHRRYGGVVPELASRSHIQAIVPVIERALAEASIGLGDLDAVAATYGPGLIGSLLVGLSACKAIAFARGLPFIGVNHHEGHLLSIQLDQPVELPYLALLVSGGDTSLYLAHELGRYELLGTTRDDAAGEAFDKGAKILGLGYPGGRVIDQLASGGEPGAIRFPRARLKPRPRARLFDFSFSGLKTALAQFAREGGTVRHSLEDVAASYQEAIVDMLLETTFAAAVQTRCERIVIAGGVSANSRLRGRAADLGAEIGVAVHVPPLRFCTDNAAMIAWAARCRLERGERSDLSLNADPNLDL